jgi:hypothetical protein
MIFFLSQFFLLSILPSLTISFSSHSIEEVYAVYGNGKKLIQPDNNNCFDSSYFEEKSFFIPLSPDKELVKLAINGIDWDKVEIFRNGGRFLLIMTEHPNYKVTRVEIKPLRKKCSPIQSLSSLYSDGFTSPKSKNELIASAYSKNNFMEGAMIYVRKRRNLEPLFRDLFGIQGRVSFPEVNLGYLKTDGGKGLEVSLKSIKFQRMIVSGNYFDYFLRIPYDLEEDLSSNVAILIQDFFFSLYVALDENKGNGSCLCVTLKSKEPLGRRFDPCLFGIKNRTYSWIANDGSILLPDPPKNEPQQAYFNVLFKFIVREHPKEAIHCSRALPVERN